MKHPIHVLITALLLGAAMVLWAVPANARDCHPGHSNSNHGSCSPGGNGQKHRDGGDKSKHQNRHGPTVYDTGHTRGHGKGHGKHDSNDKPKPRKKSNNTHDKHRPRADPKIPHRAPDRKQPHHSKNDGGQNRPDHIKKDRGKEAPSNGHHKSGQNKSKQRPDNPTPSSKPAPKDKNSLINTPSRPVAAKTSTRTQLVPMTLHEAKNQVVDAIPLVNQAMLKNKVKAAVLKALGRR